MTDRAEEIGSTEAAEILGVNVATVSRWASQGKIRHWRTPGGTARFRREDIEAIKRLVGGPEVSAPAAPTSSTAVA